MGQRIDPMDNSIEIKKLSFNYESPILTDFNPGALRIIWELPTYGWTTNLEAELLPRPNQQNKKRNQQDQDSNKRIVCQGPRTASPKRIPISIIFRLTLLQMQSDHTP